MSDDAIIEVLAEKSIPRMFVGRDQPDVLRNGFADEAIQSFGIGSRPLLSRTRPPRSIASMTAIVFNPAPACFALFYRRAFHQFLVFVDPAAKEAEKKLFKALRGELVE